MSEPPAASPAESEALLRLLDVPRLGRGTLRMLLRRYGSGTGALAAVLRGRTGLPSAFSARLEAPESIRAAHVRQERLSELGGGMLVAGRAGYPQAMLRLQDPPPVIFFRGRLDLLEPPAVAVLGARRCTPYGIEATRVLASGIARAGVTVVSGLARGIDGAAHQAALDVNGATIAVVGTGLDLAYPREHHRLQERVAREGLLLSEYPPGTGARRHHFPERNRLITVLSTGMIVVEAGPQSGTRKTVDLALEQGLTVFAVPGPIGRPQSEGTHQMLREGAALATSAEAVLEELRLAALAKEPSVAEEVAVTVPPTGAAARLMDALAGWELTLDELAAATGLEAAEALPVLLELELDGRVERRAGARFAAMNTRATRVATRV